ncbi:trypsin-like peptidase domain-containing protein [Myxococcus sp. AM009]|uniref:S1C family serine protease n=1 Tax=unclassified Myxococcus TaxID=2648731 RepID=UPI001596333B|nr:MULTISPECIES: serine protease [unclassified Myxococcus]NVI99068.1 trypsin-like peptidase domain-containing protein [Myxococcus sp. AM009]NVJ18569.1 trypsin-like peptidase domain-containing protein [Myxococcus sp. AM010]
MFAFILAAVLTQSPVAPAEPSPPPAPGTPEAAPTLPLSALPPATHELFQRIEGQVAQVRIIERRSGTRSSIGSAFFVSAAGHAVTNYHVVSDVVIHPEDYTAELVLKGGGEPVPVRLVDVDVVHDLAIIQTATPVQSFFDLDDREPPQGARLFAMGNPRDLGTTIVEGTYNGFIHDALYERLHFSGAINPGMSGGPTLTGEGRVVGVNVATMGNQVGFLVPVKHARELLARALEARDSGAQALLDTVRAQLLDNQQRVTERLLAAPLPRQTLGSYRVPGRWGTFLKCWGDTPHDPEVPYTVTNYQCSSEEDIFVSSRHRTGVVAFLHQHATSQKLGALRFSALYSALFSQDPDVVAATRQDVTNYRCQSEFVDVAGLPVRAALCMRAYRKFPGLYDLVLRAATLNASTSGVDTSLTLAGFTADNGRKLARRYLEGLSWTK